MPDYPDYNVAIDLDNRNTSHVQVLELAHPSQGKRILDVGCWSGDLGRALMEYGCRVSGVEIDAEAASVASKSLEKVVVADLDREQLTDHFEKGSFDVIVFADVLEHLYDPVGVLRSSLPLLAPEGRVVISLPNVAHGSLRLAHLQGRWDLSDTGLLDRTHIRFFNRDRLFDLFEEAGLVVEDLRGTTADPLRVEVEVGEELPAHVVEWVRDQPDAFVYQFQASARVRKGEEPVGRRVPLQEARPVDELRLRDEHAVAHERIVRDELAVRDQIVGLQAQVATLEDTLTRVRVSRREKVDDLRSRLDARNKTVEELRREVDALRGRPGARLRRKLGAAKRRLLG